VLSRRAEQRPERPRPLTLEQATLRALAPLQV